MCARSCATSMLLADFGKLDLFFDPGGRPRRFFLAMGVPRWESTRSLYVILPAGGKRPRMYGAKDRNGPPWMSLPHSIVSGAFGS
jgi:hypothetical protein